jgi:hypothetical protein
MRITTHLSGHITNELNHLLANELKKSYLKKDNKEFSYKYFSLQLHVKPMQQQKQYNQETFFLFNYK